LRIVFANESAVYFKAATCIAHGVENYSAVGDAIMRRFAKGMWDGDHAIVTNLFKAGTTTAIVSAARGALIEIGAASGAMASVDLADSTAQLTVNAEHNIGLHIVSRPGLVPLFGLSKIQAKKFWQWLLRERAVHPLLFASNQPVDNAEVVLPGDLLRSLRDRVSTDALDELGGRPLEDMFHFAELP